MKPQQYITDYVCPHSNQQEFLAFDYTNSKIKMHLCIECQKIPEFLEVLKRKEKLR